MRDDFGKGCLGSLIACAIFPAAIFLYFKLTVPEDAFHMVPGAEVMFNSPYFPDTSSCACASSTEG